MYKLFYPRRCKITRDNNLKVVPNGVYEIRDNEIIMKGIKEEYECNRNPFLSLNVIIDSLKQHKIYCSQKEMDNIQFKTPNLE